MLLAPFGFMGRVCDEVELPEHSTETCHLFHAKVDSMAEFTGIRTKVDEYVDNAQFWHHLYGARSASERTNSFDQEVIGEVPPLRMRGAQGLSLGWSDAAVGSITGEGVELFARCHLYAGQALSGSCLIDIAL